MFKFTSLYIYQYRESQLHNSHFQNILLSTNYTSIPVHYPCFPISLLYALSSEECNPDQVFYATSSIIDK